MDPSSAPWRVLESNASAVVDEPGSPPTAEPPARAFLISPITAAAAAGAMVLIVAAFVFASASTGAGTVSIDGGGALASLDPVSRSGAPDGLVAGGAAEPGAIVVEIAGAVRRPGVFHLPAGSRVGDLVAAAGGYGPRLDTARASRELNLAARLADGDRVTVPSRDEAASSTSVTGGGPSGGGSAGGGSAAGGTTATTIVDLNRATEAELEALPGIGPVTAAKIVASREEHAFASVDDLRTRKLVGGKTFDKLKALVAVH